MKIAQNNSNNLNKVVGRVHYPVHFLVVAVVGKVVEVKSAVQRLAMYLSRLAKALKAVVNLAEEQGLV